MGTALKAYCQRSEQFLLIHYERKTVLLSILFCLSTVSLLKCFAGDLFERVCG